MSWTKGVVLLLCLVFLTLSFGCSGPGTPGPTCRPNCSEMKLNCGASNECYTVISSTTCVIESGQPYTVYSYTVRRELSGVAEIVYFEVLLPDCTPPVTQSDIIYASPQYDYFGRDTECSIAGNVIRWEWREEYGNEKTFILTVKGNSTDGGSVLLRVGHPDESERCRRFDEVCAPSCD